MNFFRKLDEYISKYYKNKLIKGSLVFVFVLGLTFLCINFMEFWLYLPKIARLLLLIFFCVIMFTFFTTNVLIPVLKILNISKRLNYKDAEKLIRSQFPEIKDQLLNLLELDETANINDDERQKDFIKAAIQQKIDNLSAYNFVFGINFKKNLLYLRWALIPLLAILLFLLINPTIITNPTNRIIHYRNYFEKPSPFKFEILNENLEVLQNEDFNLQVKSIGDEIPEDLYIQCGDISFKMKKNSKSEFSYIFKNVYKDIDFQLKTIKYLGEINKLKILVKPTITDIKILVKTPKYTGIDDFTAVNSGNLQVPEGSNLKFQIHSQNVDTLFVNFNKNLMSFNTQVHSFYLVANDDLQYYIIPKNRNTNHCDTINYVLQVIKDQYPKISVDEYRDSAVADFLYFSGQISDDYGFSDLSFIVERNYQNVIDTQYFKINYRIKDLQQDFVFSFDLKNFNINLGEKIEYYFVVSDNDGVNGAKQTTSKRYSYYQKTEEELNEEINSQSKEIIETMQDNMKKLQENNKALDNLMKDLIDKKEISWTEKKKFQDILKEQQSLMERHEQAKLELDNMFQNQQKLSESEEKILEKQKLMEELYDKVMTDEMKKTLEELQKMLQEQMSKEEMQKKMEQIKLNNEEIEKQLDQNIEIFKRMEVERKFEDLISALENLKEKQSELRNEISDNQKISEEQKEQQKDINQKFEEIQKEITKTKEENQALENPIDINTAEESEKKAEESLENADKEMKNGNNQKAKQSQQSAETSMQEMADAMQASMEESEDEDDAEDAEKIRKLLRNIVIISKNQEAVEEKMKNTAIRSSDYPLLMKEQQELNMNMRLISDSLYALGKRQPIVAAMINEELKNIKHHSINALNALLSFNSVYYSYGNQKNFQAIQHQQLTMTSLNNLAVFLAESLKDMENSMQGSGKGKQGKPKPSKGQGKGKGKSASELQKELNARMEQMKKDLKDGGKQPNGKQGQQSMSEQLARAAAAQEAIRKMMQEAFNEIKSGGGKISGDLQGLLDDMEKTERELVNKIINENTLKRQQDIMTRLLEHEKAELQREQEEKRKSNEARQQNFKIPDEVTEKQRRLQQELESIRKMQPKLRPYYKQKVQEYFE